MTPKRTPFVLVIAAAALAAMLGLGCHGGSDSSPSTEPDASALGRADKRAGVAVNSTSEIGFAFAEMGLVQWAKTAADTTATQDAGTAETAIGIIGPGPASIEISAVQFNPAAALTASDTQNAIIKVFKRNAPDGGGGTTQTLLATAATFTPGKDGGTGNWNPWTPVNFTMASGAYVSPGDCITLTITKNGVTGVSVPQGELNLYTSIR